jgi:hypothetical protein
MGGSSIGLRSKGGWEGRGGWREREMECAGCSLCGMRECMMVHLGRPLGGSMRGLAVGSGLLRHEIEESLLLNNFTISDLLWSFLS